ncbi:MAG: GGDEF domain-containing protein [Candidatus Edwardsbacteria bacterium]|nr:GGDEF domain-containing protein [Candidatus Edwardsbacteria bacterium]
MKRGLTTEQVIQGFIKENGMKEGVDFIVEGSGPLPAAAPSPERPGLGDVAGVSGAAVMKGLAQTGGRILSAGAAGIEAMQPTLGTQPMIPGQRDQLSPDVAPGAIPEQRPLTGREMTRSAIAAQETAQKLRDLGETATGGWQESIDRMAKGNQALQTTADVISGTTDVLSTMALSSLAGPLAPAATGALYGSGSYDEFITKARDEMAPAIERELVLQGMSRPEAKAQANIRVEAAVKDQAFMNAMLQGSLDAASQYLMMGLFPKFGGAIAGKSPALAAKITGTLGKLKLSPGWDKAVRFLGNWAFQHGQEEVQNYGQRALEVKAGIKGSGLTPRQEASQQRMPTALITLLVSGIGGSADLRPETQAAIEEAQSDPSAEKVQKAYQASAQDDPAKGVDLESARGLLENSEKMTSEEIRQGLASIKDPRIKATTEGMIGKLKAANKATEQAIETGRISTLTGKLNRAGWQEGIPSKGIPSYAQRQAAGETVIYADLDNFKGINDAYGDKVGDEAIKYAADIADQVAKRHGIMTHATPMGDENIFSAPAETDPAAFSEDLRATMEANPFIAPDGKPFNITFSVGIGEQGGQEESANMAAKLAKYMGRNRVATAEQYMALTPEQKNDMKKKAEKGRIQDIRHLIPGEWWNDMQARLMEKAGIPTEDWPDYIMDRGGLRMAEEIKTTFDKTKKMSQAVEDIRKDYQEFKAGTPAEQKANNKLQNENIEVPPQIQEKPLPASPPSPEGRGDIGTEITEQDLNVLKEGMDAIKAERGVKDKRTQLFRNLERSYIEKQGLPTLDLPEIPSTLIPLVEKALAGKKLTEIQAKTVKLTVKAINDFNEQIKASPAPTQEINIGDLQVGDSFTIKGEKYSVKAYKDGEYTIQDGKTYKVDPFEKLMVDQESLIQGTGETSPRPFPKAFGEGEGMPVMNREGRGPNPTPAPPPVGEGKPLPASPPSPEGRGKKIEQAMMEGMAGREMPRGPMKQKAATKSDRGTIFDQEGLKTDREVQEEKGQTSLAEVEKELDRMGKDLVQGPALGLSVKQETRGFNAKGKLQNENIKSGISTGSVTGERGIDTKRKAEVMTPPRAQTDAEARMEEAFGIGREPIIDRMKRWTTTAKNVFTRTFRDLDPKANNGFFADAVDWLRLARDTNERSRSKTLDYIRKVTAPMNRQQFKGFSRLAMMKDLIRSIDEGLYSRKALVAENGMRVRPENQIGMGRILEVDRKGERARLYFRFEQSGNEKESWYNLDKLITEDGNRLVATEEQVGDASYSRELPFGFKNDLEAASYFNQLKKWADGQPEVKKAVEMRGKIYKAVGELAAKHGVISEENAKNYDRYFHRQVLEYFRAKKDEGAGGEPGSLKNFKAGFQHQRLGSSKDYNTNILEADFEVISQMLAKIERKQLRLDLKRKYGIKVEPYHQIPKGFVEWAAKPGSVWFETYGVAEELVDSFVQALKESPAGNLSDSDKIKSMYANAEQLIEKSVRSVAAEDKMVIPQELAKAMDGEYFTVSKRNPLDKFIRWTMSKWKQWVLLNPFRFIKYNLNNMSGDLDVTLAYNPSILREGPATMKDLLAFYGKKGESQDVKEAVKYGVISSGQTVNEIQDISSDAILKVLTGRNEIDPFYVKKYFHNVRELTNFRESFLRLAAYKWFRKQTAAGRKVYGASEKADIDGINDPVRKAAKLSRELLGDYGALTEAGNYMRERLIPFYSWMEINTPRYVRIMKNMGDEGRGSRAMGQAAAGKVARAAMKLPVKIAQAGMLMAAVNSWNHLVWPEEEKKLSEQQRRSVHVIIGRDKGGNPLTIRFQGALSDALDWVGLEDVWYDVKDIREGKATIKDKTAEAGKAVVNKVVQSIRPDVKLYTELLSGKRLFPDVFKQQPIRDRTEHALGTLGAAMNIPYRYATGKPMRPLGQELTEALLAYRTVDAGEAAYGQVKSAKYQWLEKTGKESAGFEPTPRANALYNYKLAQRYGDKKAEQKYFAEYKKLGGNEKQLGMSLAMSAPLAGIKEDDLEQLLSEIPAEALEKTGLAYRWYLDNMLDPAMSKIIAKRRGAMPEDNAKLADWVKHVEKDIRREYRKMYYREKNRDQGRPLPASATLPDAERGNPAYTKMLKDRLTGK